MKKLIILVAATLLLMSPAVACANLLSNPGFENATQTPWTMYLSDGNTGSFTYGDPGTGQGGTKSVKFDFNGYTKWGMGTFEQIVAVNPDTDYGISAWVKTASLSNAEAFFSIEYQKTDNSWVDYTEGAKISGTTDWTQLTLYSSTPSDVANLRIALRNFAIGDPDVSSGVAYWDNADISPTAVPEPATLLLLGSGLVGLLGFVKKKR